MKLFWVDVRPWNKEIATAAIEAGAQALVVDAAADARASAGSRRSRTDLQAWAGTT